jgi:hypothetical protein
MSIESRATSPSVRPSCPQPTRAEKTAMALIALLVSSMLLGSVLSLFEMRSDEAAMARAPAGTQASTDGLALRKASSEPRS